MLVEVACPPFRGTTPRRRPPLEARIMEKRHAYVTDSLEIADRCVKEARRLGLS